MRKEKEFIFNEYFQICNVFENGYIYLYLKVGQINKT